MKCHKKTPGVGNYLKYHKSAGGKLQDIHHNGVENLEFTPSCTGCKLRVRGCMERPGSVACMRSFKKRWE